MKKSITIFIYTLTLFFIYTLTLFFISCTQPADKTNSEQNNSLTIKSVPNFQKNTDPTKPYFAYVLTKNDTVIKNIISDQPICLLGDKNIAIALDSSHHMLVNGDVVNIYLNRQTVKTYTILADANDSNAVSILFSFTQKGEELPQLNFDSGKVIITKLIPNSCDGNFNAHLKSQDGDNYFLKGAFQNAITNH